MDDFLRKNPDYDTLQEIYRVGIEREFNDLRYEYWVNRKGVSMGEAFNLRDYYDFHQTWDVSQFDSSRVNWSDVALDSASVVLGFFGLNEFTESLKIPILIQKNAVRAGTGLNVITTVNSAINGDPAGTTLGIAGFIPGPIGILASGASLLIDFGKAYDSVQYKPSVPR